MKYTEKDPINYYKYIRETYENSYLAEDTTQIIIGINCSYLDSTMYSYEDIRDFIKNKNGISDFSGLFGVFAYETIHYFERINEIKSEQYYFPNFIFSDADAYLHFDKKTLSFTFHGDKSKYEDILTKCKEYEKNSKQLKKKDNKYSILTNKIKEKNNFIKIVKKAKKFIKEGDIFQVVLSTQMLISSNLDPMEFYEELSKQNPSPYMFYFPTKYGDVIGSSPEILLKVNNNKIFIAPIAGTRPRGKDEAEDLFLAHDLLNDEKELAEHRMLIDLARNDAGKFSESGSVTVERPMHIEYFQHVMHIVSEVYGNKKEEFDVLDILTTAFPAGTLSGSPKIRAMEIISELEEYKRHIYGGGIGFLHYNGDSQIAIIIRTAFYNNEKYFIQSGAGIVFDSNPEKEYQEICHKRKSLINVFNIKCEEEKV